MSDLVSDHWRGERSEKDLYPKVFEVEIMCEDTKMVLNTCYYLLSANVTGFQLLVILIPVMSSALLFTFVMGIIAGHHVTWWLTFTINYLLGKYLCFSCCNWNFLMLLPLFQHLHFSWLLNMVGPIILKPDGRYDAIEALPCTFYLLIILLKFHQVLNVFFSI